MAVSARMVGDRTARICLSTYEIHEHSIMTKLGAHSCQPERVDTPNDVSKPAGSGASARLFTLVGYQQFRARFWARQILDLRSKLSSLASAGVMWAFAAINLRAIRCSA